MDQFKSLKDHVYQYISEKINNGTLVPEAKINEKMVIEDLNISRTPVREALIQLATEGYLENIPRKGFIVKRVDEQKAMEIYSLLGLLDGFAASLSVDALSDDDILQLEQLYEKMELAIEANDIKAYYAFQNQFHDTYTSKCGNSELVKIIQLLKKIFIRQNYRPGGPTETFLTVLKETNQDHQYMIKLFKEKRGDELERFLREQHWNPELASYDAVF